MHPAMTQAIINLSLAFFFWMASTTRLMAGNRFCFEISRHEEACQEANGRKDRVDDAQDIERVIFSSDKSMRIPWVKWW